MSAYTTTATVDSPMEALDVHLRQGDWTRTDYHRFVWEQFAATYGGASDWDDRVDRAVHFAEGDRRAMTEGRTVFVTADIVAAVSAAAQSMPNVPLAASLLPAEAGLIVLGETLPYYAPATDGDTMPIRAIAWVPASVRHVRDTNIVNDGVALYAYVDTSLVAAYRAERGQEPWPYGSPPPLFACDVTSWAFGMPWGEVDADRYTDEDVDAWDDGYLKAPHVADLRRWLLALFTFMADEIVPVDRHPALSRPAVRRAARAGRVPEDGLVTYVHLRRRAQAGSDGARHVEWSHSWMVSGHWRKLRDRGTGEFEGRVTWVRPHIKGDGPLVVKERVMTVHR